MADVRQNRKTGRLRVGGSSSAKKPVKVSPSPKAKRLNVRRTAVVGVRG